MKARHTIAVLPGGFTRGMWIGMAGDYEGEYQFSTAKSALNAPYDVLELEPTNVGLEAWLLHGHNHDTVNVWSAALFADHLDAAGIEPHLLTIDTNHSAPLDPEIDRSERNRPEWAAPALGVEASAEEAAIRAFVSDQLRSGMQPDAVADLVHDAILSSQFWIVTDDQMVQSLAGDHEAPLAGTNPPERALGG